MSLASGKASGQRGENVNVAILRSGEGVVPTSLASPDSCAGPGTAQSDPQNSTTTCGDGQRAQEMKEKGSREHFAQLSLTAAQGSADYPGALAERRVLFPLLAPASLGSTSLQISHGLISPLCNHIVL